MDLAAAVAIVRRIKIKSAGNEPTPIARRRADQIGLPTHSSSFLAKKRAHHCLGGASNELRPRNEPSLC